MKNFLLFIIGLLIFVIGCLWIVNILVENSNEPYHVYRIDYMDGKHDTVKAQKFKYYFDEKCAIFKPSAGAVTNVKNVICIDNNK